MMQLKKKKKWTTDDTELTFLALPTVIWYALFCFLPMFGILIAFKTYRVQAGRSFVYSLLVSPNAGFKNFEFILKANKIAVLLRNTLAYNIVFIILGIVIPVILAIMINELYSRWKSKIYQTMMFFPFFMSWVIVSYIVYVFLNAESGILNRFLIANGGEAINWYAEPKWWPAILIATGLWKNTGYGMIVYLAQITGIDKSYYEAAAIDGATKFQQIIHITLPSLKPIITVMFILSVGKIFYTDFGLFYQVTQQIPGSLANTVSTLDTYVYQALRTGAPIGMISAVTAMQSVACCITILLANWLIKKLEPENALI
ncbi:MAG: ABC transporter permease subunit [Treponema sp.]